MAPPEVVSTVPFPPAVKERPILFSAPMVRALLDSSKTQTRRVVKPGNLGLPGTPLRQPTPNWNAAFYGPGIWSDDADFASRCPYGQPGDRLWVREAWATHAFLDDVAPCELMTASVHYSADGTIQTGKGRPSIHMPRKYSRIDLEITGVRVERLQDISEADAKAEGALIESAVGGVPGASYVQGYRSIWEEINSADSWAANPWVWCVEFRRIRP